MYLGMLLVLHKDVGLVSEGMGILRAQPVCDDCRLLAKVQRSFHLRLAESATFFRQSSKFQAQLFTLLRPDTVDKAVQYECKPMAEESCNNEGNIALQSSDRERPSQTGKKQPY